MNAGVRNICSGIQRAFAAAAAPSQWRVMACLAVICLGGLLGAGQRFALASHTQGTDTAPATCGLPASGIVYHNNTYTLTADCTQTGTLQLHPDIVLDPNGSTITINGGGLHY